MNNENPFNITRDDVLELAAQKLADHYAEANELSESVDSRIAKRLEAVLGSSLQKRVDDALNAELQGLLSREIVPVDIWGEASGKPTTVREALAVQAKAFWNQKVNANGEPSEGYSTKPRHQYMFEKCAKEMFAEAIKTNVVCVLGSLKEAIRDDARASIDTALNELVRVKSLKEQGK